MPSDLSALKEILEKHGSRCNSCGGLATREQEVPEGYNLTCGSLQFHIEDLRGQSISSEELQMIPINWVKDLRQHQVLAAILPEEYSFGTKAPYKVYYCDTCGSPTHEYKDIDVAPLVRKLFPVEPIPLMEHPTRFERVLEIND